MWRMTEIQAILDDAGDASLRLCWQALSGILDDEDIDPVLQDKALVLRLRGNHPACLARRFLPPATSGFWEYIQ